jgi:HAD superfamily hydrolase (TIGR01549 family)
MTELLPNELEELLPAVFHELYHEVFATKQAWELCEETMYVLTKLAAWRDQGNGPKLGVISNFDERLHGILTDLGIIEFFDFIITSREIGAEKPSRKIFEVGMSRIRCTNPSSVVHVGDSVETDVLGAHAAGLMPVLLNEELDDVHVDWGDGSINRNPKPDPDSGIEGTEYLMSDHWRAYLEQTASKKLAAAEGIRFIQIATFDQLLTVFGFPDDPDKLIKVSVARWLTEED